jgi:peptide/nickel transport system permease protein
MVGFWILVALFGSALAPMGGEACHDAWLRSARATHNAGSDYIGRDILSRLLIGARLTLGLALVTTILAFVVGIVLGFTAALGGEWIDTALSRGNDALLAFPSIILALIAITALGSSIPALIMIVGLIEAHARLSSRAGIGGRPFRHRVRRGGAGSWRRHLVDHEVGDSAEHFASAHHRVWPALHVHHFADKRVEFSGPWRAAASRRLGCNGSRKYIWSAARISSTSRPAAAISSLTIGVNLIVDSFVGDDAALID